MVNLPGPSDQPARPMGERNSYRPRSRYWTSSQGRRGREEKRVEEPTSLLQLEELAKRSVELMEKYNPQSEANYAKAMDLLRLQYNLNFIVVCDKCGGPHKNDELLAPER